MLSRYSFRPELLAYRASMSPAQNPRRRAELELIDRWIEQDRRAEEVWRQIRDCAAAFPAVELIKVVLFARNSAWQTVNGLDEWSKWKRITKNRLDRALSRPAHRTDPTEIIEILQTALTEARFKFGRLFADVEEARATKFNFSQKIGKLTVTQRLFSQILVDYFVRSLGKPLHDAVATLAEIAFEEPGAEPLASSDIANALKPTTERGRSRRSR